MALTPGTRLGVYEVTAQIGEGGMGQVWRARDTKLNRDVALKVLPDAFANDPDRLARFTREAQTLAALNHPNIAAIYGIEAHALVMELVEGEDLSQRIERGAIPLDEALPIAKQIAEALEAAHEQGIIHRDLKPANVKVRPDGTVKVLDFGLAKAMDPAGAMSESASMSPTMTSPAMTQAGMILGTAAYMAPEQAKGKSVDKRADVWAFGVVLYEMLTGRRAFAGSNVAETLAAVISDDPDWNVLPPQMPSAVRGLVQGCLQKDRKTRVGDISTARFILGNPGALTATVLPVSRMSSRRTVLIGVAGLVVVGAVTALVWQKRSIATVPVTKLIIPVPVERGLALLRQAIAIAPDGANVVYATDDQLFLRPLSGFDATPIRGTTAAVNPVFSPDGQSLVFWSNGALRKVPVVGGTPVELCKLDAPPYGMSWDRTGIVFSAYGMGIFRVDPITNKRDVLLDLTRSAEDASNPQVLPDGETLLFTSVERVAAPVDLLDPGRIILYSPTTKVRKPLLDAAMDGRYLPTGHIAYVSGGTVFARPFDTRTSAFTGAAVPIIEGVQEREVGLGLGAMFVVSDTGTLAHVPGPAGFNQQVMALIDRAGQPTELKLRPGAYGFPRVSRDGGRVAFETSDGKQTTIEIYDLSGTTPPHKLIFEGNSRFPVWSPDGKRIVFQGNRQGELALWWQPVDGGSAHPLTRPLRDTSPIPESWSPNGDVLLFSATKDFRSALRILSMRDMSEAPFSDVKDSSIPTDAAFSPDGGWVAYQIGRAGGTEGTTYVQPFPPNADRKHEITKGGRPIWSRDRDGTTHLFVIPAPRRWSSFTVNTASEFSVTSLQIERIRGFGSSVPAAPRTFDIMPDGRVLGLVRPAQIRTATQPIEIRVELNWFDELKRLVPR